jgi:hypothetical protein
MHGFATEVFPNGRTQDSAAVTHAGIRRAATALELQVPLLAACISYFAKQDGAAVAKLRYIHPKLMPGIERRQWLGAGQDFFTVEIGYEVWSGSFGWGEVQQGGGFRVEGHQVCTAQRLWRNSAVVVFRQRDVCIVKNQCFKRA